jgi:uncharacterized protein (UPF0333 family)
VHEFDGSISLEPTIVLKVIVLSVSRATLPLIAVSFSLGQ